VHGGRDGKAHSASLLRCELRDHMTANAFIGRHGWASPSKRLRKDDSDK
jgi:hypothetical protein